MVHDTNNRFGSIKETMRAGHYFNSTAVAEMLPDALLGTVQTQMPAKLLDFVSAVALAGSRLATLLPKALLGIPH